MMKTVTALSAAGVLAIAAVAAPAPAQAGSDGAAIAAGVVGGLAAGAIIGSALAPRYGYGYYGGPYAYSRCYTVRQRVWTDFGPRWRRVRVCD
jgi:hypothetical protein